VGESLPVSLGAQANAGVGAPDPPAGAHAAGMSPVTRKDHQAEIAAWFGLKLQ
jgi:hypothetical protein